MSAFAAGALAYAGPTDDKLRAFFDGIVMNSLRNYGLTYSPKRKLIVVVQALPDATLYLKSLQQIGEWSAGV